MGYNENMKEFGNRLRELRKERSLTLEQLGKHTNLTKATLSRWENNRAEIKAPELVLLAKYFGVTTDYLLGLED